MQATADKDTTDELLWYGLIPIEVGDTFFGTKEDGTTGIFEIAEVDSESAYFDVGEDRNRVDFSSARLNMKSSGSSYKDGSRWVRSDDPNCPLETRRGCIYPDGRFRTAEKYYEKHEYFLNPGFLIVLLKTKNLDFDETEATYDAVRGSLEACFNYCGGDVPVLSEQVASLDELVHLFDNRGRSCSHIILIGHGSRSGIEFFSGLHSADEIRQAFNLFEKEPKQLISLCCHSGCAAMAAKISESPGISHVLAPEQAIPNYYAAHFILGYLIDFFFESESIPEAVDRAKMRDDKQSFVVWENGKR